MDEQVHFRAPAVSQETSLTDVVQVSHFSVVLGLSGLGYALLNSAKLWGIPKVLGEILLAGTLFVWAWLLVKYMTRYVRAPKDVIAEFRAPMTGSVAALIGVSTLVFVPALASYSVIGAWVMSVFGVAWHLGFSAWHGARLWRGGRSAKDSTPALYLPDIAGNFTSAAALGVLGFPDWAWLFFGAGVFSWLTIEPVVKTSIIHGPRLEIASRSLMGIQAAPAVVCGAALFNIDPQGAARWVMLLLGYSLFQMLHGLRLLPWLKKQPFAMTYWAYTFGMTSALNCCLKLALLGNQAAKTLSAPLMVAVSGFMLYLMFRTLFPPSFHETQ